MLPDFRSLTYGQLEASISLWSDATAREQTLGGFYVKSTRDMASRLLVRVLLRHGAHVRVNAVMISSIFAGATATRHNRLLWCAYQRIRDLDKGVA
jgi:hypothetical protein